MVIPTAGSPPAGPFPKFAGMTMSKTKNGAAAPKKASEEIDVFEQAGIDVHDVGLPFLDITSNWKPVTILAVRKPERGMKKIVGDDNKVTEFPVFAEIDVTEIKTGAESTWDVSSKRLLADLRGLLKGRTLPVDIRVKATGRPPRRVYHVEPWSQLLDDGDPETLVPVERKWKAPA